MERNELAPELEYALWSSLEKKAENIIRRRVPFLKSDDQSEIIREIVCELFEKAIDKIYEDNIDLDFNLIAKKNKCILSVYTNMGFQLGTYLNMYMMHSTTPAASKLGYMYTGAGVTRMKNVEIYNLFDEFKVNNFNELSEEQQNEFMDIKLEYQQNLMLRKTIYESELENYANILGQHKIFEKLSQKIINIYKGKGVKVEYDPLPEDNLTKSRDNPHVLSLLQKAKQKIDECIRKIKLLNKYKNTPSLWNFCYSSFKSTGLVDLSGEAKKAGFQGSRNNAFDNFIDNLNKCTNAKGISVIYLAKSIDYEVR